MQRSALCRSRRELSNVYFLAKFRFDAAENEPCKVCLIEHQRPGRRVVNGLLRFRNGAVLRRLLAGACRRDLRLYMRDVVKVKVRGKPGSKMWKGNNYPRGIRNSKVHKHQFVEHHYCEIPKIFVRIGPQNDDVDKKSQTNTLRRTNEMLLKFWN